MPEPQGALSLPTEILQQIVGDEQFSQQEWLSVSLISHRLHAITLPLLYRDPNVFTQRGAYMLYATLRFRDDAAACVKVLRVQHLRHASEQDNTWDGQVNIPNLPNCEHMTIWMAVHSIYQERGIMTFYQALEWAVKCPQLRKLDVHGLQLVGRPLRHFRSEVPPELTTLHIHYPIYDAGESHGLWDLCYPWLQTLHVTMEDATAGFEFLTSMGSLDHLHGLFVHRRKWNCFNCHVYLGLHPERLAYLEELECPLQKPMFRDTHDHLRILTVHLDHLDMGALHDLCDAVERGRLPALQKLTMLFPERASTAERTRGTALLKGAIVKMGLPSLCNKQRIELHTSF